MNLPPITPAQIKILLLIYQFRFLNRLHIQSLLKHKDPHRIKSWLTDLTTKEYLTRIYSNKFPENTKPAIYHLNLKSKKYLKQHEQINNKLLNRVYREKIRSRAFIDHYLFLADIYLSLISQNNENKDKLHFYTKTQLTEHSYLLRPLPDAYIALTDEGSKTKRYFIEIFEDQVPRFVVRKRIEQYIEYFESKEWETQTKNPFPIILLVCPNETGKKYISRFITKILEEDIVGIVFSLTTREEVQKEGVKL